MINRTTTALAASLVIASNPAALIGLTGINNSASGQYIQIHDAASLPADGAVPKVVMFIDAGQSFSLHYGETGRYFSTGIVICNSSTLATKTIGSADCWFDAQMDVNRAELP